MDPDPAKAYKTLLLIEDTDISMSTIFIYVHRYKGYKGVLYKMKSTSVHTVLKRRSP
jgi:hypothetical protein